MTQTDENFLRSADGLRLFFRYWPAQETPRFVALIAHGMAEHSGRYEDLAGILSAHGASVWAIDHRGHGHSEGRRGDFRSFQDYLDDFDLLTERARAKNPGLPVVLIGHSLGGLIALAYAAQRGEKLAAVVASAPALELVQKIPALKVRLAEILSKIAPATHLPNGVIPGFLSHDPTVVNEYKTDPLIFSVITARAAVALRKTLAHSASYAAQITIPCLILQGEADPICSAHASQQFASHCKQAVYRGYPGFFHEIFNETGRQKVFDDLIAWIDEVPLKKRS